MRRFAQMARWPALVGLLFVSLVAVHAQLNEGIIAGAVTDATGAAVAGANVKITNLQTGSVDETKTDNIGYYRVLHLQIGAYQIRIEAAGFKVRGLRLARLTPEICKGFYAEHVHKGFYPELESFMTEGPVVLLCLEAENAILRWRELMGATDPAKAAEGTLRKRFGQTMGRNATHGSDSPASAARRSICVVVCKFSTTTVLDPAKPEFTTGKYGHNFIGPTSGYWAKMNPGKKFEEVGVQAGVA